jgi:hypothetical protein
MQTNKKIISTIAIMVIISALYRVIPSRPQGFAPQWAIAIFSGFLFANNKKWAFALPIASMLVTDILFETLYACKLVSYGGFYGWGQLLNYALFAALACIGFFIKKVNIAQVVTAGFAATTLFFLASNLFVLIEGGGFLRPKNFQGLLLCYQDGLPFYLNSIGATALFSFVFFGAYSLFTNVFIAKQKA